MGGRLFWSTNSPRSPTSGPMVQWSNQFCTDGETCQQPKRGRAERRAMAPFGPSIHAWLHAGVTAARVARQRANMSSRTRLEPASRFFASAGTAGEACASVPVERQERGAYLERGCTVSASASDATMPWRPDQRASKSIPDGDAAGGESGFRPRQFARRLEWRRTRRGNHAHTSASSPACPSAARPRRAPGHRCIPR